MMPVVEHLRANPVMAILRAVPRVWLLPLARALLAGGVRSLEVTYTDADADDKVAMLVDSLPKGSLVGAGTVTTVKRAEAALEAGASFLVTPHVVSAVNSFARNSGLPVVGGAMTPSEVAQSLDEGCAFIKLFPAGPLGPKYLGALLGPYPDLEVFAVGGISGSNARAFFEAGAVGVGVGGAVTALDWAKPDLERATVLAQGLTELALTLRGAPK